MGQTIETCRARVNYDIPVEEMVVAGQYDYNFVDDIITTPNFPRSDEPSQGAQEIEIELVHFGEYLTTDQVLTRIDELGYRLFTPRELLALGAQHPDLQRQKGRIVALGAVWQDSDGNRYVLCLFGDSDSRTLDFEFFEAAWNARYWFAVVRKQQPLGP